MRTEDAIYLLITLVILVLAARAWQLSRYRYELAKLAIERGGGGGGRVLAMGPPMWVLSARQGVMLMAGGVALLAVGVVMLGRAAHVPMPPDSSFAAAVVEPAPANAAGGADRTPRPDVRQNPAVERWHRAQELQTFGFGAAGVGGVLVLLGGARLAFAFVERRYTPGDADLGSRP